MLDLHIIFLRDKTIGYLLILLLRELILVYANFVAGRIEQVANFPLTQEKCCIICS